LNDRKPLSVLRILLAIGETSAPYNHFCLALSGKQKITICTYFKPNIAVPETIKLFAGDDSLPGFFRALRAALDEEEYDVIHTHTPHVGLILFILTIFRNRKIRRFAVHTVHNSYLGHKLRNRLMLMPIFAFFQRIVFCSNSSSESFPEFFKRLAGGRACVIQNGVDIDRVDRVIGNNPHRFHKEIFRIVSVNRLITRKKPLSVLRAFHEGGDQASELVFIGNGNLRESLVAESKKLGLEKQVRMTGLIEREAVYRHLAEADLFVSASAVEGLPIAVLEAMASRCPVLLSDIPPHREIASGTDFIPLIPHDDLAGFAQRISTFRQMSPAERAEVGERCRQLVEKHFSLAAMHKKYEQLYLQVIKHSN